MIAMYRRPQGRKLAAGHGDRGQGRPWEGICQRPSGVRTPA